MFEKPLEPIKFIEEDNFLNEREYKKNFDEIIEVIVFCREQGVKAEESTLLIKQVDDVRSFFEKIKVQINSSGQAHVDPQYFFSDDEEVLGVLFNELAHIASIPGVEVTFDRGSKNLLIKKSESFVDGGEKWELKRSKSGHRTMIYTTGFKDFIKEQKDFLLTSFQVINFLDKKARGKLPFTSENIKVGNISVSRIGSNFTDFEDYIRPEDISVYYSVELLAEDNQKFFVKVSRTKKPDGLLKSFELGTSEIESMANLAESIKNIPKVRVIEYQLGYFDTVKDHSFFVSKWEDYLSLNLLHILNNLKRMADEGGVESREIYNSLLQRGEEIRKVVKDAGFSDVEYRNMGYDPSTDSIVFFDIRKSKE